MCAHVYTLCVLQSFCNIIPIGEFFFLFSEDQDVNEIVVKIETVKPEKKEQDKKVSKKGKKGRKNNDWLVNHIKVVLAVD